MNDNAASIISKVWSFCNTLRDDGVGYGDCRVAV
jgi:type I restriction enzyme M protein